jgi:hypothetical protein
VPPPGLHAGPPGLEPPPGLDLPVGPQAQIVDDWAIDDWSSTALDVGLSVKGLADDVADASDAGESQDTGLGSDEIGCDSSLASQSPSLSDLTEQSQLHYLDYDAPEFFPVALRSQAPVYDAFTTDSFDDVNLSSDAPVPSSVPFPLFPGLGSSDHYGQAPAKSKLRANAATFVPSKRQAPLPVGPLPFMPMAAVMSAWEKHHAYALAH